MRHYFGYDIDGALCSVENYGPAGWPSTHCMEDPECDAEAVLSLRERRAQTSPEIVGYVLYDCPCDASQGYTIKDCACYNQKFAESMVDIATKTLKLKPLRSVYVDAQVLKYGDVVTEAPGTAVVLKVVADVADGETVHCIQRGLVDLTLEDEWDLTFSDGETDTKTLVAPAQGSRGTVYISGRLIRPLTFALRGFTVAE